jgi:6-phosphogluconolactonase (cycloisomerase 2 family)
MYKNSRLRNGALMLVRAIALLLMAWCLLLPLQANAVDPTWQGVWSGTLGKQPIVACLDSRGRSAYFYARYQREIPLTEKDGAWDEYNQGELSGVWTLSAAPGDQLAGQWQDPKSQRTLPIRLQKLMSTESAHPCESLPYKGGLSASASVTNTSGVATSANIANVGVARASRPEYAYVMNSDNTVSVYRINAATGALTQVSGSPFVAVGDCLSIITNFAGTFAYVASTSGITSAYRINAATGSLTSVAGSPFAAGKFPIDITVNSAGTFAYEANEGDNTVSVYRINAATGALTQVVGSPFALGAGALTSITVNPAGTFAYVTVDMAILAYRINAITGALTPVAGGQFGSNSIAINSAGTFVYATNPGDESLPAGDPLAAGSVSVYRINATTGALTEVAGSPFAAGRTPTSVTVNASGTFVYVANIGDQTISVYRINATTGALTPVAGSPFYVWRQPQSVNVNLAGTFVYMANTNDDSILVYRINATTGALTEVAGSPFEAGNGPLSVTIVQP